jgi:hypothetical protein
LTFDYIKNREYSFVISDEEREFNKKWVISKIIEIQNNYDPVRIKDFVGCKYMCMGLEKCNPLYAEKLITIAKLRKEGNF